VATLLLAAVGGTGRETSLVNVRIHVDKTGCASWRGNPGRVERARMRRGS
jgi:hypothetical protein